MQQTKRSISHASAGWRAAYEILRSARNGGANGASSRDGTITAAGASRSLQPAIHLEVRTLAEPGGDARLRVRRAALLGPFHAEHGRAGAKAAEERAGPVAGQAGQPNPQFLPDLEVFPLVREEVDSAGGDVPRRPDPLGGAAFALRRNSTFSSRFSLGDSRRSEPVFSTLSAPPVAHELATCFNPFQMLRPTL